MADLKVWLPYVRACSGTDVYTNRLASALRSAGVKVETQAFAGPAQYAPWLLMGASPPPETSITLCNSWNGFAFARPTSRLLAVNHLCVHDPALDAYRTPTQRVFHHQLVRQFEAWSFARADAVVAVSDYTARQVELAFPGITVESLPNGVDIELFSPGDAPLTVPKEGLDILFVGNLSRRKGADLLPEIMRRLGTEYRLHYTSGLRDKKRLPDRPNLHCLGSLDELAARDAYRRADVVLFPTRLEGHPFAALEGMSCGKPVIASRVASLPELIDHGRTGWLCPVNDVDAFVTIIRRIHSDTRLRLAVVAAARRVIVERFSAPAMANRYLKLFDRLMARQ